MSTNQQPVHRYVSLLGEIIEWQHIAYIFDWKMAIASALVGLLAGALPFFVSIRPLGKFFLAIVVVFAIMTFAGSFKEKVKVLPDYEGYHTCPPAEEIWQRVNMFFGCVVPVILGILYFLIAYYT